MKKELGGDVLGRAAELARAFDAGFARPPEPRAQELIDVLAIRLGNAPHALRLAQVAGLYAQRPIAALPSAVPELLGLVSLRAAIVPVYDLASLLGRPAQQAPRWLVLAAAAPVALAFDTLDGYRRLAPEAIVTGPAQAGAERGPELARVEEELRPMVDLRAVLDRIAARASAAQGA
ncbi:MAG TPA: chemotaxis protein CheW [Polyangiaceae bacterium]|jgi:purine-binding chemotaxis protein CheW|nr:chemotaxis protein CheW [Polyangiaceae bacterium]